MTRIEDLGGLELGPVKLTLSTSSITTDESPNYVPIATANLSTRASDKDFFFHAPITAGSTPKMFPYAIDKAQEVLADWEVTKAVINGGTSTVLALGKEWDLGVGGPWGEKVGMTSVKLKDQALSGSGTEVKGNHIINPKTGKAAMRHLAAWAIHPSAACADALSTAFMMMELKTIEQLCAATPGMVAFVVTSNELLKRIGV